MSQDDHHPAAVIANFDAEAPRWDSHYRADLPGGMRQRIERFTAALQSAAPQPGQLLDFGCGSGVLSVALATIGWQVIGADASEGMLAEARRKSAAIDWRRVPSSPPLGFAAASFDAIVASSVLEYLADPASTLRELAWLLRPGGLLVFSVPDLRHPLRRREAVLCRVARLAMVQRLGRDSRWAGYLGYLRLSVNRLALEHWQTMLASSGLQVDPVGRCEDPLALLVARKP